MTYRWRLCGGRSDEGNSKTMSGETSRLKGESTRFNQLLLPLAAVAKINVNSPEALDEIDRALEKLPDGETFGRALDEVRTSLRQAVEQTRTERSQAFSRIEADYIREAREKGQSTREVQHGWRVGKLEMQHRRAQSQVRFLYNHEVLVDWKPIRDLDDLQKREQAAEKLLAGAELPSEMLVEVFWDAYAHVRERRSRTGAARPEMVPILDFYREFRLALVRHELTGQKPDRKLKYAEFPLWTFLYNLDRYRALGAAVPAERRLALATGSQQDVAAKRALSVNGLDANDDYKIMCYVQAQPGTGA
ncbi:MAG: hypothetical protein QOJ59_1007 [Thermomicrobiales bacterium]|jgi:hypothetical protein|nr:hypothetical protein [Thermomicrobiales bacterium]